MTGPSQWIYLSPHLDDAVLSCGGLIWQQINTGLKVEIWTIFAGSRPDGELTPFARSLHERWQGGQDPAAARRQEDIAACCMLGADFWHFDYPDCIYRYDEMGNPVINREEDLFRPVYRGESTLLQHLEKQLASQLPRNAILAAPYGFGNHVDHQLVRLLAGRLHNSIWLYADYPYSSTSALTQQWLGLPGENYQLAVGLEGLRKWQDAIAAYETQISTFWVTLDEMRQKIAAYCRSGAGSLLHRI